MTVLLLLLIRFYEYKGNLFFFFLPTRKVYRYFLLSITTERCYEIVPTARTVFYN